VVFGGGWEVRFEDTRMGARRYHSLGRNLVHSLVFSIMDLVRKIGTSTRQFWNT
jgi:hypothetical protein